MCEWMDECVYPYVHSLRLGQPVPEMGHLEHASENKPCCLISSHYSIQGISHGQSGRMDEILWHDGWNIVVSGL